MSKGNRPPKLDWVLADLLELPRDLVMDLPRITIVGPRELHLVNHRGILEYGPDLIKVNLARGYLEIEGEDMEIKFIMQDELSLSGRLKALRFIE